MTSTGEQQAAPDVVVDKPANVGAAARGSAVTLVGQWGRFAIQTVSIAALAHLLTPQSFGLIAMVTSIVGIAFIVGDFGLSLAAIQARELTQGQRSNLFWSNTAVSAVAAIIIFALARPIAAFYGQPDLVVIVQVLSATFVLNGLATQHKAELTRALRFGRLAALDVLSQLSALIVALAVALSGGGYWALVAQQMTASGVGLLLAVLFSRWRPGWWNRRDSIRSMLTYGVNTMGVQSINYVSSNIDNVMVGRLWGSAVLGLYSRAYNLFELPVQQLAAPLTRVVLPILSRVTDDVTYVRYLRRAQTLLSYTLVGSFLVIASMAQAVIAIALGPRWGGAVSIFQVLAIGGVFQAIGYLNYWVFLSKGKTGMQLRYTVFARAAMVGFIVIGVQFSALGAAVGATAGLALLWVILSVFAVPRLGVPIGAINRDCIRVIVGFSVVLVVNQAIYHAFLTGVDPWATLGIQFVIALACVSLGWALFASVRADFAVLGRTAKLVIARKSVPVSTAPVST